MRRRRAAVVAIAVCVVIASACGGSGRHAASRRASARATTTTIPAPSTTTTTAPSTTTTTNAPVTTSTSTRRRAITSTGSPFHSSVAVIDPATAATMSASWRPGCPVPLNGLRILTMTYWGFDGAVHTGRLVVNARWANALAVVFQRLFDARFPIERMLPVDAYGGDDDAAVAADDTSAFNCRPPDGGSGWSEHAYGLAVDVNPLRNPYIHADGSVKLAVSRPWVDRSQRASGMIAPGDVVVRSFAAIGWGWGGYWSGARDLQHFSANGH